MAELRVYSLFDTRTKTINLTGNSAVLIRGHSTAELIMGAEGVINLDTVIITNGSAREYGVAMDDPMSGYVRAEFPNVQTDTFSVRCEDADGNFIRKDVVANMIVDYIDLTCHIANNRPDASGNVSLHCFGNYFNDSFGKVANTLTVQYRYRIAGGSWSSYTSMSVSKSGNTYSAFAYLTGLNYEATYEFEFRAADQLMTVDTALSCVTTLPVFHWGASDFAFEVPVDFKSKGVTGLKINDTLRFKSVSTLIEEPSAGTLELHAAIINLAGSIIQRNGQDVAFAEYGTWTPYLGCSGVYLEQRGWYSKCGNTVTVGFRVKIYPDSGYNTTDIEISGLPFIPAYAAAGGGLCSGALVSGGFDFQCFVAETRGLITTRVQACNNTGSGSLATSASGCKYPPSSGELTLSGTITYMTA